MPQDMDAPHKFLKKPPKRLAVVDQNACSGCAGAPACVALKVSQCLSGENRGFHTVYRADSSLMSFFLPVVTSTSATCLEVENMISLSENHSSGHFPVSRTLVMESPSRTTMAGSRSSVNSV